MDFTKDDFRLMNDLINIAWQAGVVKSPQMGQGLELLRQKVVAKIEPVAKDEPKGPKEMKK
jgi:hypothetical protein